ncbi:MAG: hypothetical protein N3B13_03360 [Deltaproteobacteria bacterium]|nr:hypothetical protein [Deltaproteobacteria bacterium]
MQTVIKITLSSILLVSSILLSCSGKVEDGTDLSDSDINPEDVLIQDISSGDYGTNNRRDIKISVRSNFPSENELQKILIMIFKGEPDIIPDSNALLLRTEWETDKAISVSLDENEGILALIDNNGNRVLDEGDYFGLLRPSEIKNGEKKLISSQDHCSAL